MDSNFSVNARWVVSEIIDGEAILLDLRFGSYYSSVGVGALIWQAILDGASRAQVVAWAQKSYPDIPSVDNEVTAFLQALLDADLMQADETTSPANIPKILSQLPYQQPRLEKYDDMKDLFMLDPIHDVDEVGWPVRKMPDVDVSPVEPQPG